MVGRGRERAEERSGGSAFAQARTKQPKLAVRAVAARRSLASLGGPSGGARGQRTRKSSLVMALSTVEMPTTVAHFGLPIPCTTAVPAFERARSLRVAQKSDRSLWRVSLGQASRRLVPSCFAMALASLHFSSSDSLHLFLNRKRLRFCGRTARSLRATSQAGFRGQLQAALPRAPKKRGALQRQACPTGSGPDPAPVQRILRGRTSE